jgi:hypothetical protein
VRLVTPGIRESSRQGWEKSQCHPNQPASPLTAATPPGQACVALNGKDHLIGPYGSKDSREAYDRLIAEWLGHRGRKPTNGEEEKEPLSVNELILSRNAK